MSIRSFRPPQQTSQQPAPDDDDDIGEAAPVVDTGADDDGISPGEAKARWEWTHPFDLPSSRPAKPASRTPKIDFVPPPDMPDFLRPDVPDTPPTTLAFGLRPRRR